MNNSNYTLRFSRTSREAYGHQIEFHENSDKTVFIVVMVCAAFIIGMMLGGAI